MGFAPGFFMAGEIGCGSSVGVLLWIPAGGDYFMCKAFMKRSITSAFPVCLPSSSLILQVSL